MLVSSAYAHMHYEFMTQACFIIILSFNRLHKMIIIFVLKISILVGNVGRHIMLLVGSKCSFACLEIMVMLIA